jgi:membrane dipeptidase
MVKKKLSELGKNEVDRARELHKKAIFINALDSTHLPYINNEFYELIVKSGVTSNYFSCVDGSNFNAVLNSFMIYNERVQDIGEDRVTTVRNSKDIVKAKNEEKIAFIIGTQRGRIIEEYENLLEVLYHWGLRIFGLCYNIRNYIADGCNELTDAGLSAFGHKVINKCNELGILIDLSHVGRQSSLEVIAGSKDPVVFTHSNARAIYKNRRNLYDEQIKAIGEKKGVIGVCAWGPITKLLTSSDDKPTLEDMLDHVDYFVDLIGVDHVGIGLDLCWNRIRVEAEQFMRQFDQISAEKISQSGPYEYSFDTYFVDELQIDGNACPSTWPIITEGLVARGYSDDEILKILGGNFMRVFEKVWDKNKK